jgi:hypothetical protein
MVDPSIKRFKAILGAWGFTQANQVDYEETFLPTARMDILQRFLAIVAFENLEYWHCDITHTYVEAQLKEKVMFQLLSRVKIWPGYDFQALRSRYHLK